MKKLAVGGRARKLLGALCLGVTTFVFPWYGSFLFLGEPEIPELLKEDQKS